MPNQTPITLAITIWLLTTAVAYARTGSPQLHSESLPTNTALVIALFALLGGVIRFARTGSAFPVVAGHIFGAAYILSFVRLRAGQASGAEIGLLASFVLAVARILAGETGWNPLPKELGYVGMYGVGVFAFDYGGVWLAWVLGFSLVLLAFREDLGRIRDSVDHLL